jgi:hypothetical protein
MTKACVPQLRKAYVPQQCMGGTRRRINQLRKAYVPQQWEEHGGGLIS